MTPTNHLVPPPLELVQEWMRTAPHPNNQHEHYHYITLCAAQWGADQELEACCEWLEQNQGRWEIPASLRDARRPKSPSLKEQALAALEVIPKLVGFESERDAIRLALEALNA
jgi:hypothetical protein